MSIKTYLEGLYDYNYWANHRYLKTAETLNEEQIHRRQGNTSSSIHDTLLHMMSTETIWLKRWQGDAPKQEFLPVDFQTLISIRENWMELEKDMRSFLAAQNEGKPSRRYGLHRFQWQAVPSPVVANDGSCSQSQYTSSQ